VSVSDQVPQQQLVTPPMDVDQDTRPQSPQRSLLRFIGTFGTLIVLAGMFTGFSIALPGTFPTWPNISNILTEASLTAIVAGGLTFPLIVGEFDLSIGYASSLSCVLVVGFMTNQHMSMVVAIVFVLLIGAFIGFINGLIVTKLGVNALIATLGTGTVLVGIDYAYCSGIPIGLPNNSNFPNIFLGKIGPIHYPILIMLGVLVVLWLVVNRTDLGQAMQAIGGNLEASRLSGIRVDRVKTLAFMVAGTCAAGTGILLASQLGTGELGAGDGYLLDSFAACFLGSAALRDGQFHILGTFIGVVTVGLGFTGLIVLGAPTFYQYVFEGLLLILAVALSTVARRYVRR
jgi:ribose transport system permease protein